MPVRQTGNEKRRPCGAGVLSGLYCLDQLGWVEMPKVLAPDALPPMLDLPSLAP
jgi:hypothetical protein